MERHNRSQEKYRSSGESSEQKKTFIDSSGQFVATGFPLIEMLKRPKVRISNVVPGKSMGLPRIDTANSKPPGCRYRGSFSGSPAHLIVRLRRHNPCRQDDFPDLKSEYRLKNS